MSQDTGLGLLKGLAVREMLSNSPFSLWDTMEMVPGGGTNPMMWGILKVG